MGKRKGSTKNAPKTEQVKRNKVEESKRHISSVVNEKLKELCSTGRITRSNPQRADTESQPVPVKYTCKNKMPFPDSSNSNNVLDVVDIFNNPEIKADKVTGSYDIVPKQTVHLPKLSVHKFADSKRFSLNEKNAIKILYRDWMQKFIDYYYKKGMQEEKIIALTGPQGIGKSYCLYLLCAKLRKDDYRVLYLPACRYLSDSFKAFGKRTLMVQELRFAFYEKEMQDYISNYEADRGVSLEETLSVLQQKYMELFKRKVILIFDQLNTISAEEHQGKVESLLKTLSNTIPTVVSYSANCNIDTKDTYYSSYQAKDFELKEEEAKAFIKTVVPGASYSDEEMKDIIDVTGAFPLHVAELIRAEGDNLAEKIGEFKDSAYESSLKGFKRLRNEAPNPKQIGQEMFKILLLSGRETKELFTEYDKKIVKKTKSGGFFKYTIINPTAKKAIWKVLSSKLKVKTVDLLAEEVFMSSRSNGAKGLELEYYIIHKSIKMQRFVIDTFINVTDFEFKYFTNSDLNQAFFQAKPALLMIPEASNHPTNDMYLYKRKENVLYGIQVTIEDDAQSHLDKAFQQLDNPESRINLLLYRLAKAFESNPPQYHQIFITKSERVDDEKSNGYLATNLNHLANDYPAVQALSRE